MINLVEEFKYIPPTPEEKKAMFLEIIGLPNDTSHEKIVEKIAEIEEAQNRLTKLAIDAGGPQNLDKLTGWMEKLRTMDGTDSTQLWMYINDYKIDNKMPPWNI
ncbi:MAG: hypothetical protein HN981_00375 [Candidatus Pacebacteria bacterium]|jgi:hypothetical protein|nr:hypothetical protein [Candidatus Paceibacterota bacterium]MBT4651947.1 hypothetical protein [Candidatus Paceibacterota bacterium]MBT6755969.1 hypothetical protein [Candidatus Paceibacterota bacterium]MBT6920838.1 hypothetical protein [Candidatus Paceibacterota bacterium]